MLTHLKQGVRERKMKLRFLSALILAEKNIKLSNLRKQTERLRSSLGFFGVDEAEIQSQVGWVDSLIKDFKKSPLKSFVFIFLKVEDFEGKTNHELSSKVVREIFKYSQQNGIPTGEKYDLIFHRVLFIIQRIDFATFRGREDVKISHSMSKFKERKDREKKSQLPY